MPSQFKSDKAQQPQKSLFGQLVLIHKVTMGPIVNWEHWFGLLRATWFLVPRRRLWGTRDDQCLLGSSSVQLDPFPEAVAE